MKLTARLVLFLILGIAILLVVDGFIAVRREVAGLRADMRGDARVIGTAVRGMVEDAWRRRGTDYALNLLRGIEADDAPTRIRWVWFDAPEGSPYRPLAAAANLDPGGDDGVRSVEVTATDGPPLLCTYVDVAVPGGRAGALELSESLEVLSSRAHGLYLRTAALLVISVLLGGAAVVLLGVNMVGRPLHQLRDKVRRIAGGDLAEPLALPGRHELTELAEAINVMCERLDEARERIRADAEARLEMQEQLRHADRLKTVGHLSAGIAHELGTPLNVVSGHAGLIGSGQLDAPAVKRSAATIKAQSERMTAIVRQLLDFSRRGEGRREPTPLRALIGDAVALLAPLATRSDVRLEAAACDELVAHVDAPQIEQVLTNLIVNAIQATPPGGRVAAGVRRVEGANPQRPAALPGPHACIYVEDEGEGIPQENLTQLFDPFFTTRDVGEGTGLGLAITYGIVQEHDGWIEVRSRDGAGSRFSAYLPMEATACPAAS